MNEPGNIAQTRALHFDVRPVASVQDNQP